MSTNTDFNLQTHLTEMEGRLTDHIKSVGDNLKSVENRVRKLENWRNYLAGAWAVVVGAGTYLLKGKS